MTSCLFSARQIIMIIAVVRNIFNVRIIIGCMNFCSIFLAGIQIVAEYNTRHIRSHQRLKNGYVRNMWLDQVLQFIFKPSKTSSYLRLILSHLLLSSTSPSGHSPRLKVCKNPRWEQCGNLLASNGKLGNVYSCLYCTPVQLYKSIQWFLLSVWG